MFHPTDRAAILIDGHNLYATAKNLGIEVDYKSLLSHFADQTRVVTARYYTAIYDTDEHQPMRPLVDWLEFNGWNTITKSTREYITDDGHRKVKGSMAVELTLDAVALAPRIDHIILFTGDRDYCPLVKHLQSAGTRVTVASSLTTSPPMIANDLRRQADAFIELDDLRTHITKPVRNVA